MNRKDSSTGHIEGFPGDVHSGFMPDPFAYFNGHRLVMWKTDVVGASSVSPGQGTVMLITQKEI